ncbi:MAG: hypothetical protein FJX76_24945 [Armatimonadetes bacterium]|nr:hypothetical protein [Armatimonadota bacterium]
MLMTAIFISVFMFFLSVALVATNRQDVLLALTADSRYRAHMAARAGTAYALQVMRERSDWQTLLTGGATVRGTLTGASWEVSVAPFRDAENSGLFWDVSGWGRSSGSSEPAHLIVEEAALVPDPPTGYEALLFAYTADGNLAVLDGALEWRTLGAAPSTNRWLAARDGPLFTFYDVPGAQPPVPAITAPAGNAAQPTFPEARHVGYLALQGTALEPFAIEDPGVSLGSHVPESYTGDAEYAGPAIEWYSITGTALAADGERLLCHAIHTLWQGPQLLRVGEEWTVVSEATRYEAPAVLAWDNRSSGWEKVVDLMQVSNPRAVPTIASGPRPDTGTLCWAGGRVYALQDGNARALLVGESNGWTKARDVPGASKGLFQLEDDIALHETGDALPAGLTNFGIDGHFPNTDLGGSLPALTMELPNQAGGAWDRLPARPEILWDVTALGDLTGLASFAGEPYGADCVATLGTRLFTFLRVRRAPVLVESQLGLPPWDQETAYEAKEALVLGVFDGERWQVLPGGLGWALTAEIEDSPGNEVLVKDAEGNDLLLDPRYLAAALYREGPDAAPPTRRFAVVGRYKW